MLNKNDSGSGRQRLIVYIILTAVTLAVFGQVSQFDFINFDDNYFVTNNFHIQSGFTADAFRWALTTNYADLWHPLTWLSLMLDYRLYGLNAGGFHLTSLFLHILSTLLLFNLFHHMTKEVYKSAFVAAVFAIHPLHVESVTWISERKDVLSAFFWILTLCLYAYYSEKPGIKRYLPALFCFVLALMSKPMVITLPLVMILLDYWPLRRFGSGTRKSAQERTAGPTPLKLLLEKIPFFVLSAILVFFSLYVPNNQSPVLYPWSSRIANMPVSLVTYLEQTFWPHDLAVYYPFATHIPLPNVLGAVLLIIVITAAVFVTMKRLPHVFAGWFWYAITLLPVIGIVQIGNHTIANRYTYIPLIGVGVMLAWGVPLLFKREDVRKKILFPAGILFLGALSVFSWQQCRYWKNSVTLFNHTLQATKDNYLIHKCLADTLLEEGKTGEAIGHYNEVIRLTPDYADAYHARGNAHARQDRYPSAIDDYTRAIHLKPKYADAYCSRGLAYDNLGRHELAAADYHEALRLKPDLADAYYNGGIVFAKLNKYSQAIENFDRVIRLKPDYAKAYNNMGLVYLIQGNYEPGCRALQKACALGRCNFFNDAKNKGICR